MLFYPANVDNFPLNLPNIRFEQQADPDVQAKLNYENFDTRNFHGTDLICHQQNNTWRIVLPDTLISPTIEWYHIVLGHCGSDRLIRTLSQHFWAPNLSTRIKHHVSTCDSCQRNKLPGPGYGLLPPCDDLGTPFEEVAVDLIGPWDITIPQLGKITFEALTVIDTTTTLCELQCIEAHTSEHIAVLFANSWLSRYPRPLWVIFDKGGEFIGHPFQTLLMHEGIKPCPITVKNPQANSICECMHSTCGDQIRTLCRENPPQDIATATEMVDSVLAAAMRALRTAAHRTLNAAPGSIVFHRDMLLPFPILHDLEVLRTRRHAVIDDNARRANLRRRSHDFQRGDRVLLLVAQPAKLDARKIAPFRIHQVHVNGTVTLERAPQVYERVNIRRIRPYRE